MYPRPQPPKSKTNTPNSKIRVQLSSVFVCLRGTLQCLCVSGCCTKTKFRESRSQSARPMQKGPDDSYEHLRNMDATWRFMGTVAISRVASTLNKVIIRSPYLQPHL